MPPDLERAAALKDRATRALLVLWDDAEARFAWCRGSQHGPRLSADAAALGGAAHANRAEAFLRLRPRAALLECRAAHASIRRPRGAGRGCCGRTRWRSPVVM